MFSTLSERQRNWALFLAGSLPCLLLAVFTNHIWEDWYIAYRSSKNLSLGLGLVYVPGEHVQTFSSPINVLLPALFSWLLNNQHDDAVLWLQRLMSATGLGISTMLLHQLAKRETFSTPVQIFLLALFVINFKIMDFSINGMETGFLVFFFALGTWAMLERHALWLGIGWGGLMWTRPDSFIYIGSLTASYSISSLVHCHGAARQQLLITFVRVFAKAAALALVLYAPWIIWSSYYYGNPIPHTVIAKGLSSHHHASTLLPALILFPINLLSGQSAAPLLFMPNYFFLGGWPAWMKIIAQWLAWFASIVWLLPRMQPLTRAASFTAFAGLYYLTYITPLPYPWYFALISMAACISLAGAVHTILQTATHSWIKPVVYSTAAFVFAGFLLLTVLCAWQVRVQQQVIEFGNRKQIGLWLKDHARSPADTVFLESLGYIGFYSGLKTFDYPGMTSPEVVSARKQVGENWLALIRILKPDWLVLRAREAHDLYQEDPSLLTEEYHNEAVFNQADALQQIKFLPGRGYLVYDQTFVIFHRRASNPIL